MYDGEPVLESRLAPKGAGAGLPSMIPPGMRAVAVHVNEVVGVAGFVVPGMRVDVLISGNPPQGNGNQGTLTKTLLQNIEVLSAGQEFKKDVEGKPISVYTGSFDVVANFKVKGDAPAGPGAVAGKLKYQACSNKACYPPKTIDVNVSYQVQ